MARVQQVLAGPCSAPRRARRQPAKQGPAASNAVLVWAEARGAPIWLNTEHEMPLPHQQHAVPKEGRAPIWVNHEISQSRSTSQKKE